MLPVGAEVRITHLDPVYSKVDVMFGAFTGGAHCCIEIKVLSLIDGHWRINNLGNWDGDSMPKPQRVDGKTILVFGDNVFLYAFAPYALSATPLKILRVENGQVVDVSRDPSFNALHRQNMIENKKYCAQGSNGGCAAYVGSAARIGEIRKAWKFMLRHFNHKRDWQLEFCDIQVHEKCLRPVSFTSFPKALAWFLRKHGYLSNAAMQTVNKPAIYPSKIKDSNIDQVALEQKGSVFVIPVQINEAITLPFIIDSGAADVQIPIDVFSTLVRTNTIVASDLIGKQTYRLADGSTREEPRFLVRELKVGNDVLRNVPASVSPVAGELLLGQTFLSQFSEWTLDNQRHVLELVKKSTESTHQPTEASQQPPPPAIDTSPMATVAVPKSPGSAISERAALVCGRQINYTTDPSGNSDGLVGVWTGRWNNAGRLCGGLIIEKIRPSGAAKVIYVYGPSRPGSTVAWKQQRRIGILVDGVLSFQDDQGSTFKFSSPRSDTLNASFVSRLGRLNGSFHKLR